MLTFWKPCWNKTEPIKAGDVGKGAGRFKKRKKYRSPLGLRGFYVIFDLFY